MPGLKIAMEIEARSENGCENDISVWSETGSGFGEQGGTAPPRIPGSTSSGKGKGAHEPKAQTSRDYPGFIDMRHA